LKRRNGFKELNIEAASKKSDNTDDKQKILDDFIKKQNESKAKLIAKYPELVPSKEKIAEIRTRLGFAPNKQLDQADIDKFNAELGKENETYRLCIEIARSDPKYLESINGPELVMEELEKRLAAKTSKPKTFTEEELEAEIARRKRLDGEGVSSTHGGKKVETNQKEKSELRQMQERAAKKAGISLEELDKSIERRKNIKGADSGDV